MSEASGLATFRVASPGALPQRSSMAPREYSEETARRSTTRSEALEGSHARVRENPDGQRDVITSLANCYREGGREPDDLTSPPVGCVPLK